LSEENNELLILSVRESTSGHETKQTPVATGFHAYLFLKFKLDSLTNSMLKSDSLVWLTQPHRTPQLNSEEEDALLEEGGQSKFDNLVISTKLKM